MKNRNDICKIGEIFFHNNWNYYYPLWAVYTDGNITDVDFVKVCYNAKQLTFNEDYLNSGYKIKSIEETMFKEVRMLNPKEKIKKECSYILESLEEYNGDIKPLIFELKNSLKEFFLDVWDTEKSYLFFHSAGYDSRILS